MARPFWLPKIRTTRRDEGSKPPELRVSDLGRRHCRHPAGEGRSGGQSTTHKTAGGRAAPERAPPRSRAGRAASTSQHAELAQRSQVLKTAGESVPPRTHDSHVLIPGEGTVPSTWRRALGDLAEDTLGGRRQPRVPSAPALGALGREHRDEDKGLPCQGQPAHKCSQTPCLGHRDPAAGAAQVPATPA